MSQAPRSNERKLPNNVTEIVGADVRSLTALSDLKMSSHTEKSKKLDILLKWLSDPKTGCIFWKDHNGSVDIVGLRPVMRTTIETINAGGFTPYEKKSEEKLFKLYLIDVVECNDKYIWSIQDHEKREMIEQNGTIYLKSENIKYIYDFIRKNK